VDPGSILGLQSLRPSLLDYLSATQSRQAEAGHGACVVTSDDIWRVDYVLDDDDDEDFDDDEDDDVDEDEDDDEEDEEDEDTETWQVSRSGRFP
jgi:hypothetical protein